jgi:hypothetical protein
MPVSCTICWYFTGWPLDFSGNGGTGLYLVRCDRNVLAGAGRNTNLVTASGINDTGHVVGFMNPKLKGGQ